MDMIVLIIFLSFIGIGIYIYNISRVRKLFFESLIAFCDHLATEIGFSKNNIQSIIETYQDGYHSSFKKLLEEYKECLDVKKDIIELSNFPQKISNVQRAHITSFFIELGKHGPCEEISKIQNKRVFFTGFYDGSINSLRKEASINLKLCIILGIASVVLLI